MPLKVPRNVVAGESVIRMGVRGGMSYVAPVPVVPGHDITQVVIGTYRDRLKSMHQVA